MAENELAVSQMKRLATYLPDPVYEELEQWASQEKRSLSNLVAFLLEKAVSDRSERQKKTDRDEAKD
jgi:hypothetical protein